MRALLLVNGLGLGNGTRCHAIMQRLLPMGAEIAVLTSGNGLWYFKDRPDVSRIHEMESLYYGSTDGKISIAGTVGAVGAFIGIARRNNERVQQVLSDFRPHVAMVDSVYNFRAVKRAGVPLVALNNSDVVHYSYRKFTDRPPSIRPQFYAIEESDYLFHRIVPDHVISPTLDPDLPQPGGKFRRISAIVREGYDTSLNTGPPRHVVVMLSGSVFGSPVEFQREHGGLHIDVVGRDAPENWEPRDDLVYHGRVKDNCDILRPADLVVVNGGFSAVSEAFCMRKPMVVVPVPNHAEQWINARTIQHLGVGMQSTEEDLEQVMEKALEQIDSFREAYRCLPPLEDGAQQAADILQQVAEL